MEEGAFSVPKPGTFAVVCGLTPLSPADVTEVLTYYFGTTLTNKSLLRFWSARPRLVFENLVRGFAQSFLTQSEASNRDLQSTLDAYAAMAQNPAVESMVARLSLVCST